MPLPLRFVAPFACAAVVSLLASAAVAQGDAPPPKVSVAAAYTQAITDESVFIGKGEAVDSVDLVARVGGFLREIAVEDGARVSQGDLLFKIEPEQYMATLAAREADLARAEANLELTRIELERKRQLVARDASPQSELDIAQANESVAAAEIKAAQAAIEQARLDLSYTDIVAPFDGAIGRIARSQGDLVGPTTGALATLVRQQPIFVAFSVSEKQLADIRLAALEAGGAPGEPPDLPVLVDLPNGTRLDEIGKLVFGDNRIDPSTGTLTVRALFDNAQTLILDGSFVNIHIESAEPVDRLLVPQAAVQRDQKGEFVLVVTSESMVEQRYVTTAGQHETALIVADGLREGESVIVEGLQRVRPGVPVDAVLSGTEG